MRIIKVVSNTVLFAMLLFLGYSFVNKKGIFSHMREVVEKGSGREHEFTKEIGGDFSLINQDGKKVNSLDLRGKYMLVLFGFSSCQSICPAELSLISQALEKIDNKKAENLLVFFITIDPERDTVAQLKDYQKNYDKRIQMLTGSNEELKKVAAEYKVFVGQKTSDHEINHSSIIYLIGKDGKYLSHFSPDLSSDVDQVKKIVNELNQKIS